MNIGLIGQGRMGREVARLAPSRGHQVVAVFDRSRPLNAASADPAVDVFIDFSHPGRVLEHVRALAASKSSLVIGTTGWYDQLDEVRNSVLESGLSLVYAPNFSVGVAVFLRLVEAAGRLFDELEDYDLFVHEAHHRGKIDSPSGTALAVADVLLEAVRRKKEILTDSTPGSVAADQLQVASSRGGSVPGTHAVFFDSSADTIELRHTARDRTGFALGSLLAAEWIHGKEGFFTFNDLLEDLLSRQVTSV